MEGDRPSLRAAQRQTYLAHFVLEQKAQRLDQLHTHTIGKAADVVVGLDPGGGFGRGRALSITSG
jgi:hypothetical protein